MITCKKKKNNWFQEIHTENFDGIMLALFYKCSFDDLQKKFLINTMSYFTIDLKVVDNV